MITEWLETKFYAFILGSISCAFIFVHSIFMFENVSTANQLKSDNPSGATLAERYLILGNWPASKERDFTENTYEYLIAPKHSNH